MIETFRVCRRAYQLAFIQSSESAEVKSAGAVCKRFILRALAEINRGRLTTVHHIQKFLGLHWPADTINQEECVKAFLFTYKTLIKYISAPYRPEAAQVVGVSLKVRARIPHNRAYVEDTFDLILWHPKERRLELVDFHIHPLKALDQAWPSPSLLVKQFLADRLRVRWPFEKLTMTFCRVSPHGFATAGVTADDVLYKAHWPSIVNTIEEMKSFESSPSHLTPACLCQRCAALARESALAVRERPARDNAQAVRERPVRGAGPQVA